MGAGAYMFALHRVTGMILTIYLFVHLLTLGTVLQGPNGFDNMMALINNPIMRAFELVLVWIVLFHTLNGVRLIVLHLVPGASQRQLALAVTAASLLAVVASLPWFFSIRF